MDDRISHVQGGKVALGLPDDLLANYLKLSEMMVHFGSNLGMPHTRALGGGLFELRVSGEKALLVCFSARGWVSES